jgi:hypothetical protein
MPLSFSPMPACCGILIVHGFGQQKALSEEAQKTRFAQYEGQIKRREKDNADDRSRRDGVGGYAVFQVNFNDKQVEMYEDWLLGLGFRRKIKEAYHPYHKSKIAIYTKVMFKEGKEAA